MSGVCAVVVTHSRRKLLEECLRALAEQTRLPERVLVVDNASTDGTREMVERDHAGVDLLPLSTNEGGAGGFHEGMRRACADGAEWIWLMDDDTIPRPDALAELLAARDRLEPAPILLASKVVWRDGRMHPQNYGGPERRRVERLIHGAAGGVMPLRFSTFVSLMVHRRAVERYGLPRKEFFIWSDDIDYTGRLLDQELGYLVPTSVVLHETPAPATWHAAPPERFYYHVRNLVLILRGPGRRRRDKLVFAWDLVSDIPTYIRLHPRPASLLMILRGLRDGLRGRGGPR